MAPPMTLASQTPEIPVTQVVRMGTDPAAAPKSPSRGGPRSTLGLSVGLRAWVFPTEDPPSDPYQIEIYYSLSFSIIYLASSKYSIVQYLSFF